MKPENKRKNRAEFCDANGGCDGSCVSILKDENKVVRCEHYTKPTYTFFGVDLNSSVLNVRKQKVPC